MSLAEDLLSQTIGRKSLRPKKAIDYNIKSAYKKMIRDGMSSDLESSIASASIQKKRTAKAKPVNDDEQDPEASTAR